MSSGLTLGGILNRSSIAARNTGNSARLLGQLRESGTKLSTNSKYLDLAGMDSVGVRRTVDYTRSKLIKIENYETTIAITEPKLQNHSQALTDIGQVLAIFDGAVNSNTTTKQKAADDALTALSSILNRRENGEYIFGGKNSDESPLLYDIVSTSNKVDGQVTSNYTSATEDMSTIDITDNDSVRTNRLNAAFPEIQQMIEMLHSYKDETDSATTTATKFTSVTQSISRLQLQVNTDIESINGTVDKPGAAEVLSSAKAAANSKLSAILDINVNEEAPNFTALSLSLVTGLSITQARNNVLSQFAQTLRG